MFVSDNGFGDIGSLKSSIRKFAKAVGQPVKTLVKDPKSALSLKKQWKMGIKMGKSLEQVAVDLNPLDPYMQKLDKAGIKAGRKGNVIAKVLGRVGEKARTKPIATTGIVYAGVVAIGKGLAAMATKGAGAAVGSSGAASTAVTGATGATGAASGGSGLISTLTTGTEYVSSGMALAKTAQSVMPGKKEEIDPFAADAEYAITDESGKKAKPDLAGMITPQNALIFLGLGALTVTGYILLNKE